MLSSELGFTGFKMKEKHSSLLPIRVFAILCYACYVHSVGRYALEVTQLFRCEDVGTNAISFSSMRLTKVSRHAFSYITNYTLATALDDNVSVVFDAAAWGNGGWRPGFFTHDAAHFCSDCKKLNPIWFHELIKNTGKEDCPVPPGTYKINAYNISYTEFTIPLIGIGKYKLVHQFFKEDALVGCIGMIGEVVTKRNTLKKKN